MRLMAIVVLAIMSARQAAADDLFTNNTMYMRVQCEIGEFAKDAEPFGLAPNMKADVDFSWTVGHSTKVEGSGALSKVLALFGSVTVKQARGWQQEDKNEISRPFNIHEGNTLACQKDRLKVPLGIRECLMGSIDALKAGADASCERTEIIGVKTDAEGEVTLLKVIDADTKGEYDVTSTYTIKVSAPARQEEQQKVPVAVGTKHI